MRDLCPCKICGAPAIYSYYGAIVCQPCKMFFRRNAESKQVSLYEINILFSQVIYLDKIKMQFW